MDQVGTVERHTTLSRGDMADVDESLAWVVQILEREFADAKMLKISIEQYMTADATPPGVPQEWRYIWSASVTGHREEKLAG